MVGTYLRRAGQGAGPRAAAAGWRGVLPALAVAVALTAALAGSAQAQAVPRAEPITGPGVTTIGNIAPGSRVNLRAGPAQVFPSVATLPYGTRVEVGLCVGGGSARYCSVQTADGRQSGFVSGRYLVTGPAPTPPDAGDGGPDFWAVRGLSHGDRLNVRSDPSPRATPLATLSEGEVVRNLGCRQVDGARWCRIRSTVGMDVTGWVSGRYLREAAAPAPPRPPQGGGAHGPDSYIVAGLAPGDRLNVRLDPSPSAQAIATLGPGERVQNLGCQQVGQARWCRIRTLTGADRKRCAAPLLPLVI